MIGLHFCNYLLVIAGLHSMNPKMSLSPPQQQQQFPAMNSPQRAGGSSSLSVPSGSSSRIKAALKPGRSLMDWVRLGKQQGKKLNGVQGQKMDVSEEELAKHNKIDDGWLAIRGEFSCCFFFFSSSFSFSYFFSSSSSSSSSS